MQFFIKSLKFFLFFSLFLLISCSENYSPEEKEYISEIEKFREEKNDYMKNNSSSPFNADPGAVFSPLKYYDVDPDFVFKSKLYEYDKKDTIIVLGTKGEERKVIKYGFLTLNFNREDYHINVYKGSSEDGEEYYSVWFTDRTTGVETYGVGRYLDFKPAYRSGRLNDNKNFIYTIDFNLAYNPYCAYSSKFSCAIPTKDDFIDFAVTAGEKNFH